MSGIFGHHSSGNPAPKGPSQAQIDEENQIKQENLERAQKLKALEQQRFSIIKSEGAPVWNSVTGAKPGQQ